MKAVNLLALAYGFQNLEENQLSIFEAQLSDRNEAMETIRQHEVNSLFSFINRIQELCSNDIDILDGFGFSFSIPQIGHEFDLLKITPTTVIDIELKSEKVDTDRIKKQLIRNQYYLSALEKTVFTFTYISKTSELYEYKEDGTFSAIQFDVLLSVLANAENAIEDHFEDHFEVRNYLVSPINDPERFMNNRYFLTHQQEDAKSRTIKALRSQPDSKPKVFLLQGAAGTGKSLLLYDIAREVGKNQPTCIVHCGDLSSGHQTLNAAQHNFEIIPAKDVTEQSIKKYSTIFVDEAQRIWKNQLLTILKRGRENCAPLFFSIDKNQVLSKKEHRRDVESIIESCFPTAVEYRLTNKIRVNRELADFIRALFKLENAKKHVPTSNVKILYAGDEKQALRLVTFLRSKGYTYIPITGSRYVSSPVNRLELAYCSNTHMVVGQEFDNVAMIMGPYFRISENGKLIADEHPNPDYLYGKLLFQGLTRARCRIALVIYGNPDLFDYLSDI